MHGLVMRRAVFADERTIDALGAGIDDALDVEEARGLKADMAPTKAAA
jgi:hypothetical protein